MTVKSLPSHRPAQSQTLHVEVCGQGQAVPPLKLTQNELLTFIKQNVPMTPSASALYEKVMKNTSIETRHIAVQDLSQVLEKDHGTINKRYETWAVQLSSEALNAALKNADLKPSALDFLIVTTCTGYLCPGLSSYVIEKSGLRHDIHQADVVGMGCGAALPALEQAANFVKSNPGSTAAVISTEICSAAFLDRNSADIIISNSIFGDASACVILKASHGADKPRPQFRSFSSLIVPEWRDTLRFKTDNGYLRNVLDKNVPKQAGQAFKKLVSRLLAETGLLKSDISHWIFHAGGEKILDSLQDELALPAHALTSARSTLRHYGNISSPSVLYSLNNELKENPPKKGEWGILGSFGAGFSAYASLLRF